MPKYRLDSFVTFTVGANGTGTSLPIGPEKYGDTWRITLISMQSNGNTSDTARLSVYRGPVAPINQVDYTEKVTGDTSNTDIPVANSEKIICQMTNATPGTICTVHFTGDLFGLR